MSFVFKWLTPIHHRHCPGQTLLRWYHLRSLRQADVIGCHLDRFLFRAASNPGGQWIRGTANCGTVATPPCAANLAEQRHPNIGLAPVPGAHRAFHPLLDKTPEVRKKIFLKRRSARYFPRKNLKIAIDKPAGFEIVVVLAKRIDETLGHFQPSHIKEKLESSSALFNRMSRPKRSTVLPAEKRKPARKGSVVRRPTGAPLKSQ